MSYLICERASEIDKWLLVGYNEDIIADKCPFVLSLVTVRPPRFSFPEDEMSIRYKLEVKTY